MELAIIHQKIYSIRGQNVMLDYDLAELYEVQTKVLNQGVKRNLKRFPEDFMFRLTKKEVEDLRSQNVILKDKAWGAHSKFLPYAFTEHGVTMLASVLKSDRAVEMNIAIVRAFVALRKYALSYKDLADEIREVRRSIVDHDEQLVKIYTAIESLLQEKVEQKAWAEREMIGFERS